MSQKKTVCRECGLPIVFKFDRWWHMGINHKPEPAADNKPCDLVKVIVPGGAPCRFWKGHEGLCMPVGKMTPALWLAPVSGSGPRGCFPSFLHELEWYANNAPEECLADDIRELVERERTSGCDAGE